MSAAGLELTGLSPATAHVSMTTHFPSASGDIFGPQPVMSLVLSPENEGNEGPGGSCTSCNCIRGMVSTKKHRFVADGFDLDLTYITDRIIAMGFPSVGVEGCYRNDADDVRRFLVSRHRNRCKVYNLCLESNREYAEDRVHCPVERIGFYDHNAPRLAQVLQFCRSANQWLLANPTNVIAVHCKAGKGRTGTMIVAYLLFTGLCPTADDALRLYGRTRTRNGKGVTIPSQIRFVRYFERQLQAMRARPRLLRRIAAATAEATAAAEAASAAAAAASASASGTPSTAVGALSGALEVVPPRTWFPFAPSVPHSDLTRLAPSPVTLLGIGLSGLPRDVIQDDIFLIGFNFDGAVVFDTSRAALEHRFLVQPSRDDRTALDAVDAVVSSLTGDSDATAAATAASGAATSTSSASSSAARTAARRLTRRQVLAECDRLGNEVDEFGVARVVHVLRAVDRLDALPVDAPPALSTASPESPSESTGPDARGVAVGGAGVDPRGAGSATDRSTTVRAASQPESSSTSSSSSSSAAPSSSPGPLRESGPDDVSDEDEEASPTVGGSVGRQLSRSGAGVAPLLGVPLEGRRMLQFVIPASSLRTASFDGELKIVLLSGLRDPSKVRRLCHIWVHSSFLPFPSADADAAAAASGTPGTPGTAGASVSTSATTAATATSATTTATATPAEAELTHAAVAAPGPAHTASDAAVSTDQVPLLDGVAASPGGDASAPPAATEPTSAPEAATSATSATAATSATSAPVAPSAPGSLRERVGWVCFEKPDMDGACKDKKEKVFRNDFAITLLYRGVDPIDRAAATSPA